MQYIVIDVNGTLVIDAYSGDYLFDTLDNAEEVATNQCNEDGSIPDDIKIIEVANKFNCEINLKAVKES